MVNLKGVDLGGPIFISAETYKSDFSGHYSLVTFIHPGREIDMIIKLSRLM